MILEKVVCKFKLAIWTLRPPSCQPTTESNSANLTRKRGENTTLSTQLEDKRTILENERKKYQVSNAL